MNGVSPARGIDGMNRVRKRTILRKRKPEIEENNTNVHSVTPEAI